MTPADLLKHVTGVYVNQSFMPDITVLTRVESVAVVTPAPPDLTPEAKALAALLEQFVADYPTLQPLIAFGSEWPRCIRYWIILIEVYRTHQRFHEYGLS